MKIYLSETEAETKHVTEHMIATCLAGNDHVCEAELLQAYLAADFEAPDYPEMLCGLKLVNVQEGDWDKGEQTILTYET